MKNRIRKIRKVLPYWLVGLVLLLAGIILIFYSEKIENEIWKSGIEKLATAITITGIFSLINNLFLSFNLIEIILEKIKLNTDINDSGLIRVFNRFNKINFLDYFDKEIDEIDIAHTYGRTWTRQYEDELKNQVQNNDTKIRVVLQNPDSKFVSGLASHYGTTPDALKKMIEGTIHIWKEIRNSVSKKSNIELYLADMLPSYSHYRFDDAIITIVNPKSKGKTKKLNAFSCKNQKAENTLYYNFHYDFKQLITNSKNYFGNKK